MSHDKPHLNGIALHVSRPGLPPDPSWPGPSGYDFHVRAYPSPSKKGMQGYQQEPTSLYNARMGCILTAPQRAWPETPATPATMYCNAFLMTSFCLQSPSPFRPTSLPLQVCVGNLAHVHLAT